ncbi:unnamed protein product [Orchesella dallaii]|uniref:Heparan-sulfate 6-O-sulfotransferase n=1 Tax=Orchesella dallaii TaxID=48710 RepID=A0ABP1PXZ2_9HEXA
MAALRAPSAVVIGVATVFFLLYLLPWQNLPSIQIPSPSPASYTWRHSAYPAENSNRLQREWAFRASDLDLLNANAVPTGMITYRAIRDTGIVFNASGSDVLVILHIQKTGGTSFEKHIVQDLDLEKPCICWKRRKRCKCPRPALSNSVETKNENVDSWLFSRFSTGWICGLHADWTELTSCVDEELKRAHGSSVRRRYFYVTMIRDPIHRFLSEFRHVQRGATWKASRHICQKQYATAEELGSCYSGRSWVGVSLKEFMSCPHNLAFNRQTRMLADLSLIGCYNKSSMSTSERNRIMLASAKRNLESMAFVGLTEQQKISQYVFEETLKLRFKIPFTQNEDTYSKATLDKATAEELDAVRQANSLDLELYQYAEQLLNNRFLELKEHDPDFDEHYNFLGEKGYHFSWDDIENED